MLVRTVEQLIEDRGVVSIPRAATVSEACRKMAEQDVSALVVMDEIGMCGILCERDVIRRCDAQGAPTNLMRVDAIMTPKPHSIAPTNSLAEAMRIMLEADIRHLPVIGSEGQVVGVVSRRDIPTRYRLMVERYDAAQKQRLAS